MNYQSVSSIHDQTLSDIKKTCEHITKGLQGVSDSNGFLTWIQTLQSLSNSTAAGTKLHDLVTSKFIPDVQRCQHQIHDVNILKHVVLFYELHPDLRMPCHITLNNGVYTVISKYVTDISTEFVHTQSTYQSHTFPMSQKLIDLLNRRNILKLRSDFDAMCPKGARDYPNSLCVLSPLVTIADTLDKLFKSTTDFAMKHAAVQLKLLVTSPTTILKDPAIVNYTNNPLYAHKDVIFKSNIRNVVNIVQQNSVGRLKELCQYLPFANSITGCPMTNRIENRCAMHTFLTLLEPLGTRYDRLNPRTRKKVLRTRIDFPTYLQQQAVQQILNIVQANSVDLNQVAQLLLSEVRKQISDKFNRLSSFYQNVANFNQQKSNADIGYLQGRLDKYTIQSKTQAGNVDGNVHEILIASVVCATLDTAYQTGKLAITIAMASNPIAEITGGSSPVDIEEAMSELAQSLVHVARAAKLLASINNLRDKVVKVAEGFKKNGEALQIVKTLLESHTNLTDDTFKDLKDSFLEKYNAYDPQVSKPQLTELGALFSNMIDEACDIIQGADSWIAAPYQGVIAGKGQCWQTKVDIEKLMEFYSEIHDFQFELMDAMADYMKHRTVYEAAKGLKTDLTTIKTYTNAGGILDHMEFVAAISYTTYKIQAWDAADEYCDIIEYKDAGIRPSFCRSQQINIPAILSHVTSPCYGGNHLEFVSIPVKPSVRNITDYSAVTTSTDTAVLDINRLLAGDKVKFQIPDSDWLVRNRWITRPFQHYAFYVKEFVLYLPVESKHGSSVTTEVTAVSENKLAPGANTVYEIKPNTPLHAAYYEGSRTPCMQQHKENPFSLCSTNKPEDICPVTTGPGQGTSSTTLYPSIYSKFTLQVSGTEYRNMSVMHSTNLNVKVGLITCMKPTSGHSRTSILNEQSLMEDAQISTSTGLVACCTSGTYWSETAHSCVSCPSKSHTMLHGYFCQGISYTSVCFSLHICDKLIVTKSYVSHTSLHELICAGHAPYM